MVFFEVAAVKHAAEAKLDAQAKFATRSASRGGTWGCEQPLYAAASASAVFIDAPLNQSSTGAAMYTVL
jgi:hypothetical protein